MGITGLMIEEERPATDELVHIIMEADYARAWVAMLNMNKIRNHRGSRISFALRFVGDVWVIKETEHSA